MEAPPTVRNPPGAERMKKIVVSALFVLFCAATAGAFNTMVMELQAQRLQSQVELQIEQIRRAREVADHRVGQRLVHLEAQLKLSEEDLERRVEELMELQRNLREQMEGAGSGITDAVNELKKTLQASHNDIQRQIHQTNALIKRVRDIRRGITRIQDSGLDVPASPSGPNSDAFNSNSPSWNGGDQYEMPNSNSGCSGDRTDAGMSLAEIERRLAELQRSGYSTDSGSTTEPVTTPASGG